MNIKRYNKIKQDHSLDKALKTLIVVMLTAIVTYAAIN